MFPFGSGHRISGRSQNSSVLVHGVSPHNSLPSSPLRPRPLSAYPVHETVVEMKTETRSGVGDGVLGISPLAQSITLFTAIAKFLLAADAPMGAAPISSANGTGTHCAC